MHFSLVNETPEICHICFNHSPETGVNAFSRSDIHALGNMIEEAEAAFPDIRMLVLSSRAVSPKGKPIFSAGADLKERPSWSREAVLAHVHTERRLTDRLRRSPLFSLCLVSGYALGFGAELCAAADHVIATPDARFGFPEARLGIVPGAGGLKWALGEASDTKKAMHHIIMGDHFDPEEARAIGLVQDIVSSHAQALQALAALAEALKQTSPVSQKALKQARYQAFLQKCPDAIEAEAYLQACIQTRANDRPGGRK